MKLLSKKKNALRRVGLPVQARPHGADLAAVARLGVHPVDGINFKLKGRTVASRCELEAYRPRSGGEGSAEVGPAAAPAASGPQAPAAVDCLNDRHAGG
jgi:hypothetical protein